MTRRLRFCWAGLATAAAVCGAGELPWTVPESPVRVQVRVDRLPAPHYADHLLTMESGRIHPVKGFPYQAVPLHSSYSGHQFRRDRQQGDQGDVRLVKGVFHVDIKPGDTLMNLIAMQYNQLMVKAEDGRVLAHIRKKEQHGKVDDPERELGFQDDGPPGFDGGDRYYPVVEQVRLPEGVGRVQVDIDAFNFAGVAISRREVKGVGVAWEVPFPEFVPGKDGVVVTTAEGERVRSSLLRARLHETPVVVFETRTRHSGNYVIYRVPGAGPGEPADWVKEYVALRDIRYLNEALPPVASREAPPGALWEQRWPKALPGDLQFAGSIYSSYLGMPPVVEPDTRNYRFSPTPPLMLLRLESPFYAPFDGDYQFFAAGFGPLNSLRVNGRLVVGPESPTPFPNQRGGMSLYRKGELSLKRGWHRMEWRQMWSGRYNGVLSWVRPDLQAKAKATGEIMKLPTPANARFLELELQKADEFRMWVRGNKERQWIGRPPAWDAVRMRFKVESNRPDDRTLYFRWTFDDGRTARGPAVAHTFLYPGLRKIKVEAMRGERVVAREVVTRDIHVNYAWPADEYLHFHELISEILEAEEPLTHHAHADNFIALMEWARAKGNEAEFHAAVGRMAARRWQDICRELPLYEWRRFADFLLTPEVNQPEAALRIQSAYRQGLQRQGIGGEGETWLVDPGQATVWLRIGHGDPAEQIWTTANPLPEQGWRIGRFPLDLHAESWPDGKNQTWYSVWMRTEFQVDDPRMVAGLRLYPRGLSGNVDLWVNGKQVPLFQEEGDAQEDSLDADPAFLRALRGGRNTLVMKVQLPRLPRKGQPWEVSLGVGRRLGNSLAYVDAALFEISTRLKRGDDYAALSPLVEETSGLIQDLKRRVPERANQLESRLVDVRLEVLLSTGELDAARALAADRSPPLFGRDQVRLLSRLRRLRTLDATNPETAGYLSQQIRAQVSERPDTRFDGSLMRQLGEAYLTLEMPGEADHVASTTLALEPPEALRVGLMDIRFRARIAGQGAGAPETQAAFRELVEFYPNSPEAVKAAEMMP